MPSNLFSRLGRALVLSGTFVVFLALITPVLVGQEEALSWFPLQIGSRWVYEHEWKAGDPERPKITRWITEETVTGLVTLPEGLGARPRIGFS
jgi:hypothetical protein